VAAKAAVLAFEVDLAHDRSHNRRSPTLRHQGPGID